MREFVGRVYGAEGVREACLQLQEEAGVDVALMLALVWIGWGGGRVEPGEARRLEAEVREWREEAVGGLRRVRRWLRGRGEEDLRAMVQAAEIEAEWRLMERVIGMARVKPGAPGAEGIAAALAIYPGEAAAPLLPLLSTIS